jgi:hypothetical protein
MVPAVTEVMMIIIRCNGRAVQGESGRTDIAVAMGLMLENK